MKSNFLNGNWNPLRLLFGAGSGALKEVATELPSPAPVKPPKPDGLSYPSYRKTITKSASQIPKTNFDVANIDLVSTYRIGNTTQQIIRNLSRVSPELSAAVAANIRVGIPEKYIAIARNPDGSFNRDGTHLALQFLRYMGTMPDYINGFSQVGSLRSVAESLGKEIQIEGAMSMELVLDKARLPLCFRPVAVSSLIFFEDGKGLKPKQKVGGEEIDLDIPTFFYTALDASLLDAYAQSPLESAVQPVLAAAQFLNDLRRICQRHVYQRYDIIIDEEKLEKRIPPEIALDPTKLPGYLNGIISQIDQTINNLGVDEALVHYDFFTIQYIDNESQGMPDTFNTVNDIHSGKVATASRTPPSILGLGARTQTVASTETLMFMVNANGMMRLKLQELFSKALTMAVRLMGLDVSVEFEYDDIELRPTGELESYRSMKQSRILTQLSFGFITDDEACLRLTYQLPPPGYKVLAGTQFSVVPAPQIVDNGNQNSTTGATDNNKAPEGAKGSTKGKAK